ncbi:MAG: beta-propeller fold lactonase family protein [Erysipelotrichaceae bacterium]|nr:beta-propeller fold lactonase family protein [Erysipelotrichaceae bacterium]
MKQIYCGCYGNEGIYKISFENGVLSDPVLFSDIASTKYIAHGDGYIASLYSECKGRNGIAILDMNGRVISSLIFEDIVSCYIGCDDKNIYTANFHEGTYSFLTFENNTLTLEKKVKIRDKAGCHMLLRCGNLILGFALYMDRIYIFNEDHDIIGEIEFPAGTGPRHGTLSADGRYLYVVSELSKEVFIISTSTWKILDKVKMSDDEKSTSAAIRLFNDVLYVTVRGIDKVFEIKINGEKLQIINSYSSGGKHPRDMIVCDGYVLCANTHSDTLACVNEKGTVSQVEIPEAVTLIAI